MEEQQWMSGLRVALIGVPLTDPGWKTKYVSSDKYLRAGGRLVLCDIFIDNSPTDAEKVEAHALRQTGDANSRWLENLTRRVHEVTMVIVPAELIEAVFLCGQLWDGSMTE
jgi:hypothetical protein